MVLGELEVTLSRASFSTWFRSTSILTLENGKAVIGVPNAFTKEWLQNKYHDAIVQALRKALPLVSEVAYEIVSRHPPLAAEEHGEDQSEEVGGEKSSPTHEGMTSSRGGVLSLNPRYTFARFVVGSNNELARAAAVAVATTPGVAYNPLFIYGGVGLGKTHLMQAIGNEILKRSSGKTLTYITSERFTSELVEAIRTQQTNGFKNRYRTTDLFLVDDIQFFSGKERSQEEFFHTFNAIQQNGGQIVITADRPPRAIPMIEDRLRSRFEGGMLVDIQPPDLETRMAIIRSKAIEKHVTLEEAVIHFIASHFTTNIRELEGALNRIIAHSELSNTPPTLTSVEESLEGVIAASHTRPSARRILEAVARFYDVTTEDLTSPSRRKEFVVPRQIAAFLMREELKASYPSIGNELGGRDHTTVMHACNKIDGLTKRDDALRQSITLIRERLYTM
ncbi:MAG: chromosomal replication initiator protein DnaA [Parcubacteria group bacterium]|nr:chromosomal replication initiator protein DnaA [Parcubacteria group bacterium]